MSILKWLPGRQGTGYFKLPLIVSKRFGFDVYLLKYPPASYIQKHTDPVVGKKHFRLNITVKHADIGGGFFVYLLPEDPDLFVPLCKRITFFRPDELPHSRFLNHPTIQGVNHGRTCLIESRRSPNDITLGAAKRDGLHGDR